jgi:hypothetical protein
MKVENAVYPSPQRIASLPATSSSGPIAMSTFSSSREGGIQGRAVLKRSPVRKRTCVGGPRCGRSSSAPEAGSCRDGRDPPDEPWICRRLIYDPREWQIEEEETISHMKAEELDRLIAAGEIGQKDRERVR